MRVQFVLSEMAIGLRRNLAMVISLVLVTFVSLYLLGVGLLARAQVNDMRGYWYDRIQVSVFLCSADDTGPTCSDGVASEAQKQDIRAQLDSPQLASYIKSYMLETREEAYKRFKEQFKDSALTDNVTVSQMPESFRISLKDPNQYQLISQAFTAKQGVQSVQDQNVVIDRLFSLLNGLKWATLALSGVVLVCAVLLVGVTIRLTAFSRRRETEIMRLVGASNFFIRAPFVLEGVFAAMIGATLASFFLWATAELGVQGWLSGKVTALRWVPAAETFAIIPWLYLVGLLIAGVSSLVVLQRYLKV